MGKPRSQRRSPQGEFNLCSADTSNGWRVFRTVSFAFGVQKVAEGKWNLVVDERGDPFCFQIKVALSPVKVFRRRASPTSITARDILCNAGAFGESQTIHLSEQQKHEQARSLMGRRPPLGDAVELAIVKVRMCPFPASRIDDGSGKAIYGDKAVRVYPKA